MEASTVDPSVFVIFGGTGDLAHRKILPALYQLHVQKFTERGCVIVGVARDTEMTDEGFRALAREAVGDSPEAQLWAKSYLYYQSIGGGEKKDYTALRARLEALESEYGFPPNRTFYIALPPVAFPATIRCLGEVGLNRSSGWTRLVIEKPFGHDLASAQELNRLVHQYFDESQVYRIDHYLGKETVQNLLVFRFANAMFETLWNRDNIDSVQITVAEELGVEQRAGYYDRAGALRDVVQNHLTQLLAVVAMEVPSAIEASAIRAEKIKALRAIAPIRSDSAVFGQYSAGRLDGKVVPGYLDEPGVAPGSSTETFVALRLHLENWRWQGVPFLLRTGKRMSRRLTEIEVKFRRAPVWMFRSVHQEHLHRNTLLLTIQPNEGFSLFFDVKAPGEPFRLQKLPLHFNYSEAFTSLPEAYQTLILDVLMGDQTLFVHADEVEAAWQLYAPLLGGACRVYTYPAGSWGPPEADALAPR